MFFPVPVDGSRDKYTRLTLAFVLSLNRMYVMRVLQTAPHLPFDVERLKELVRADVSGESWERYGGWIERREREMADENNTGVP